MYRFVFIKAICAAGGCFRIHWAPISSSLSPYGWISISPSHIIKSASSPESLWLHVSEGPSDLSGSDAMGPADAPGPTPSSLDCGPCLLPTMHKLDYVTLMIPSGHMTSIASVHPGEGSSSVALLKVSSHCFHVKVFFLSNGSFSWFDVRSWDRDAECVHFVKPSEANA